MTATITRHPDDATLMSFAAGSLPEPLAAAIAAHASMCAHCRQELSGMESLGAALMEQTSKLGPVEAIAWNPPRVVTNMAVPTPRWHFDGGEQGARGELVPNTAVDLPQPIVRAYNLSLGTIAWKRLGPGMWHHRLDLSPGVEGDLRLLKIAAGRKMPIHGHGGCELTLVLDGAYGDETGVYWRGDIQDVDDDVEHAPVADAELGCICLIASERPARFRGLVSRFIQPWTGM
jgi:putative transcriptional regulator